MKLFNLLSLSLLIVLGCSNSRSSQTDFIEDNLGILNESQITRIESYHEKLLEELDIHLKVVILTQKSEDIEQEANQLFEKFKLGSKTRDAKGILILVD